MMLLQHRKIAIVGGGPAGLTLARLLQLQRADVKVYERDVSREVRVQGATLDLHEGTGLEALRRAGLLGEFYKHHRVVASKMRLVDKLLNIKFDDHNFAKITSETRPEIDRSPLRDLLLNSLQSGTVVWDSDFAFMEQQSDAWLIHFKNGTSVYADLVIGADGANSKVRPYLSDEKPIYSGITLIQGDIYEAEQHVPKMFAFAKGGKVMTFGERSIMYGTKGDGSIMFVVNFEAPENWVTECGIDFKNREQVWAWFRENYSDWSADWQEFFSNDVVQFIPRPQYYFPLSQTWQTKDNLTIIGDAAHRMPPFAGEGANVAMQDSFELAEVLTNGKFSEIGPAIAHFEQNMLARGAKATIDTLENMERMFSQTGLEQMIAFFSHINEV